MNVVNKTRLGALKCRRENIFKIQLYYDAPQRHKVHKSFKNN